jgi:aminoglycoside phosphotransferase (APT) family kinase protein
MTSAGAITAMPGAPVEGPERRRSLWEFAASSGLRSLVIGLSKDPNAKLTVLLVSPSTARPVLAIKAPTTDVAADAIEVESRLLAALRRRRAGGVIGTIPSLVEVVEFEGRPAIVTTAVQGRPMTASYARRRHTADPARVAADFAAVREWLAQLQTGTRGPRAPLDMDAGVSLRLETRFSQDPAIAADLEVLAEVNARLRRDATPRATVHGDLWFGNVLCTGGRVSGVVDWEAGSSSGEPVRDLVRFALSYALYLDRRTRPGRRVRGHRGLRAGTWGAGVEYAVEGEGWFPDLFRRFIQNGLARLGASPGSWREAAIAGVAEVAALTDDDAFARHHLELFRRLAQRERRREENS